MGKHLRHPEARLTLVHEKAEQRNEQIRERCAVPGFGFLVLMLRAWGYGATPYDAQTYAEAKEIVNREIKNPDYVGGALIIKKLYNPDMMLGSGDPRDRPRRRDRDDDL